MPYPRSPYEKVGGIVYFGRMLDKVRLKSAGELHPDLHQNLGVGFDKRCVDFSETLDRRKKESGLSDRDDIQTMFDYIEVDEGRPLKID